MFEDLPIVESPGVVFDRIATPCAKAVVIFGCGQLGRFVLPAVRHAGITPLAFCDNNPQRQGTEVDGVPVISPAEAIARYDRHAFFLTAVYNASAIQRQLRESGCSRIVPYPVFFWKHAASLPAEERLELPHRIREQAAEIPGAFDLLADERSRREFLTQLRWRCLMDYSCLPPHDSARDMYFPEDLFRPTEEEILVDCGAFDGDSMQTFLERTGNRFRHIFVVEPDPANLTALAARVSTYPAEIAAQITTLPYALGSENGIVRFTANGDVASKVEAGGTVELPCRTLDTLLASGASPTLIKMDIEGAETLAIPGAAGVIARARPILAVCAYHRCDHLWIIPKLIAEVYPEARIFLRRYAEECWETVYYAVPPERLVDRATTGPS